MNRLILLLPLLLAFGCAPRDPLESAKREWTRHGWQFHETFGEVLPDAAEVAHLKSETAGVVRAFASDGMKRAEKELKQEEEVFLIVTMQNGQGHTYSVIFKKKK